jgi:putative transposase
MIDIIALLACLNQCLDQTTTRQMERIISAALTMTGRVTMLGISRWAGEGGSYRTVQRWFNTVLPWVQISWLVFRTHLYRAGEVYLAVGDESVISKAGKKTFGLDRFFSSIANKPIPGISFFTLALVSVSDGVSHPLLTEQVMKSAERDESATSKKAVTKKRRTKKKTAAKTGATKKKATTKQGAKDGKRKAGRPKGSRNKDKRQVEWNGELHMMERLVKQLFTLIGGLFPLTYLVLDGHFGNNNVCQMVQQSLGLHLISKLRSDSALYFEYEGEQKKSGPRRRYGDKLDYRAIPERYRMATTQDEGIRTDVYQATMLHACFADPINVVLLVKTNLKSGACAHAVLFSSDLKLTHDTLIHYYRLRFQIEFNFRDAKQFWGMEDFMVIKETPVTNAVNLALFMVNVSRRLLADFHRTQPDAGLLDLKAFFLGRKYVHATIKLLPEPPSTHIIAAIVRQVASMGAIHSTRPAFIQPS